MKLILSTAIVLYYSSKVLFTLVFAFSDSSYVKVLFSYSTYIQGSVSIHMHKMVELLQQIL